jgi:dTDP-glucose pyrophosphorylase/predicted transcriptional regulator
MTAASNIDKWRSTLVNANVTIQQALNSLEVSGMQIVLVVSDNGQLIGTLTDGDIRRAILKGLTLESKIDGIIHTNPLVVTKDIERHLVLQLMQANKILQLPVVNNKGIVVGLQLWDSITAPMVLENPMVIMAGGRGKRLYPETENCPKPLLKVRGKPMLEHIIERAKAEGFRNFLISLHYLGHMIKDYFGDGQALGVNIRYTQEASPLGTAGSLRAMSSFIQSPFVVTNGDVLSDVRYSDILNYHIYHKADATMAVRQHELQNQYGVVIIDGIEISAFEEKPIYRSYINAGIYVHNPESINQIECNEYCDMPALFSRIKKNYGRTIVYPMHEPWLDVGRKDDLDRAQLKFHE